MAFAFIKFSAQVPTMEELLCFPSSEGKLNLAEAIGTNYWAMGVFLLKDSDGAKVAAIEKEMQRNTVDINCQIFRQWLSGRGRQPVSWSTLVSVLKDMNLISLAKSIEFVKS